MEEPKKDSDKLVWDQIQMRSPSGNPLVHGSSSRPVPRLMVWLILFVSVVYVIYTLKLLAASADDTYDDLPFASSLYRSLLNPNSTEETAAARLHSHRSARERQLGLLQMPKAPPDPRPTEIHHVVFGIAASSKLWQRRKEYIKIWYKPDRMRGVVWLDNRVKYSAEDNKTLPPVRFSGDTSKFAYANKQGHRSAIRISRIVTETLRMEMDGVRCMAYGGGGFAISYPLAKALSKMQDRCIQRYPGLYGSDDRIQACMAELGVPLTKERGFHQYDVYGNLFGLLAAHPITPLVSLHHLDVVEPIYPNMTRTQALKHLLLPAKLDSAGIMQQSICYDRNRTWTISVSWGFAIQVFRGIFSPREMEMPSRTFLNWYKRADYTAYSFNTRPVARNPCQKPFVFYMSSVRMDANLNTTVTMYNRTVFLILPAMEDG
ncbi:Detected protein of confused Function [Hibiscus syriacus]|uniref:Detected protein of confused Function n=1 Tax=Hibiscus syriacus TaxID=106335 RepID=A0A6A3AQ67_HIBSY|nr:Detected protein of confused Function [Hibiscus syriacus]